MNKSIAPTLLFFDSGVGGLSVYSEVKKQLPDANYIYLFDNEAYPYGELEHNLLINRVECLIKSVIKKHKVDIVVIACNTASTIVLPSLRNSLSIPVVGVVPAIKPASVISNKAVGLIATPATVKREYTKNLIHSFSTDTPVKLLGTTQLVDMAEEKLRGKEVSIESLELCLSPLIGEIDVAVLGCTHFPLIRDEISMVLGTDVQIIDSGEAIANRLCTLLEGKVFRERKNNQLSGIAYSSAAPYQEAALNIAFDNLGFKPIETIPTQDV